MKKAMKILLVSVLVVAMLVGCGNSASNNTANDASSETTGTNGGEREQIELNILIGQPRFREQYESIFDLFIEQVAEEGIDLTINLEMPDDGADAILQTRMATNNSPDIFNFHALASGPSYARAGWFADLSDQPFINNLYPAALEAVTIDGEVIGLPLESVEWGYLINRDIFEELDLEVPNTLDEMRDVIATLEANDVVPFQLAYGDAWVTGLNLSLTAGALINTVAPDFVEEMNAGTGSFSSIAALFDIIDLADAHGSDRPFETGADQAAADFANGGAAMHIQGPWMADAILSVNPDFNLGVAPLPVTQDVAGTMINVSYSTALAVSSFSENQEIAKRLVSFFLEEAHTSEFYQSFGFDAVSDLHTFEPHPWQTFATKLVEDGRAYLDPDIPDSVKVEFDTVITSYVAGTMTQEEVIQALDDAWANDLRHQ